MALETRVFERGAQQFKQMCFQRSAHFMLSATCPRISVRGYNSFAVFFLLGDSNISVIILCIFAPIVAMTRLSMMLF